MCCVHANSENLEVPHTTSRGFIFENRRIRKICGDNFAERTKNRQAKVLTIFETFLKITQIPKENMISQQERVPS